MIRRFDWSRVLSHAVLIIASVVTLLPLLWVARTSLVSKVAAYTIPPDWFATPSLENYQTIFQEQRFVGYLGNSLLISLTSATLAVVIGMLVAYGLVRVRRGGNGLQLAVLSGQLFPRIVLIIPIYTIIRIIGGLDSYPIFIVSYLAFMLPVATAVLLPQVKAIPVELEDAAFVDGASRFTVLWRVVVPLSLPGIAAAWTYAFILGWNEFLFPLFLGGRNTRTLTVAMSAFITQRGVDIGPIAAATMLAVVPVLTFGILARKFLIEGLTSGAVRG